VCFVLVVTISSSSYFDASPDPTELYNNGFTFTSIDRGIAHKPEYDCEASGLSDRFHRRREREKDCEYETPSSLVSRAMLSVDSRRWGFGYVLFASLQLYFRHRKTPSEAIIVVICRTYIHRISSASGIFCAAQRAEISKFDRSKN
jgi:hypothetical protein